MIGMTWILVGAYIRYAIFHGVLLLLGLDIEIYCCGREYDTARNDVMRIYHKFRRLDAGMSSIPCARNSAASNLAIQKSNKPSISSYAALTAAKPLCCAEQNKFLKHKSHT